MNIKQIKDTNVQLVIQFPKNLVTELLIQQKDIPCFCKIAKDFELDFTESIPQVSGKVIHWDRRELELRAEPGAGGEYTHYRNGLVSLQETEQKDVYNIIDLKLFYYHLGWCSVITNGEYSAYVPEDF